MPLTASQREVRLRVLGRMSHNGSKLDGPHAVDGSQLEVGVEVRSTHFDSNLRSLTGEHGLHPFPGFDDSPGAVTWNKPNDLHLHFHLADYYIDRRTANNWALLQTWLECHGARVTLHSPSSAPPRLKR